MMLPGARKRGFDGDLRGGKMVGSYIRGYVKRATGDGTVVLTSLVPVVAESKLLALTPKSSYC